MSNRLAIYIGLFLLAAIAADVMLFDSANLLFLGRKFFTLLDWLAFWR